ncbi:MAG TPA: fasciclin domain-containing protein [Chitinophagaceae bacterium]
MRIRFWQKVIAVACTVILLTGCKKMTDEHNEISDGSLKKNLMQLVEENPDLSTFAGYLKATGYDKELISSKTFTVFAPSNSYFAGVDPAVLNTPARLKKFIGNHIASQLYRTTTTLSVARIAMLNGKYNNMLRNNIEGATITIADKYASNGILQVINKVLPALDNGWEFMTNNSLAPVKQSAFMQTLFRNVFDVSNAVIIGVDPNTGEPIYQPGTDSIYTNLFWNQVHDLRNEQKQYTYFMLTDAAWDIEVNKYKTYFPTGTVDSTTMTASWNVVKDFAVDTVYDPATIPDTILSKSGTKVGIDRTAIVRTVKTSNGIVYIMSKLDVKPLDKFKTYLIQAENYTSTSNNRRSNTYFRDRHNPVTGKDFRDVLVLGHGVALFNIRYEIAEMPAVKYKAYWVALNDFQTATFTQKLGIGDPNAAIFPYITVAQNIFDEIYIGEFTNTRYWPKYNIYLTAANSTTTAANPLVCDYIKLVPGL